MNTASNQTTPGVGTHVSLAVCSAGRRSGMALAACVFDLPQVAAPQGDTPPTVRLQLTPAGEFRPHDGRQMPVSAWRIDAQSAARVIERFNARRNSPVVDYEHQTLHAETNGQPAPAAGWIRALSWEDGSGLWATVELTRRAAQMIADGEYRYVSPVFAFDATTGEVLAITMAAITNNPALDGMAPLEMRAAATFGFNHDSHEDDAMTPLLKAVLAYLSLSPDTTEEAALAALSARASAPALPEELRAALELPEDADPAAAVAACTALRDRANAGPDPARFVPLETAEQMRTEIAALRAESVERQVGELVDGALEDGRLLQAQKAWATDLGRKDIAALRAYLETAEPIAALRGSQTRGQPPAGGPDANGLTADELAVCSATGVDPKVFAANKNA